MFMMNYYINRIEMVAFIILGLMCVFYFFSGIRTKEDTEKRNRKIIAGLLLIVASFFFIKYF